MQEKREYQRYSCLLKVKFQYHDGDPENPELIHTRPVKGKGRILDISKGGLFVASHTKTGINRSITVLFKTRERILSIPGTIVRTGLMKNNPSEVLKKFAELKIREDAYLAIRFDIPIEEFSSDEIAE
ncbi:MAG: PilZ domain-containing protein [Spirochaetes bacterium]|jgi:hypothetical protein|nr:PilZ domain-containing protein [Spirochaetota bacterium]